MNTTMTLQVMSLRTDWDVLTIGRVERDPRSQTMMLKGIDGAVIVESSSMETVSAVGRQYAREQGYAPHAAVYVAAAA